MLPWQWHIHQLNYQKTEVYVVIFLAAIFGNQGSRVLEKMVTETQVSKTVFSHLNPKVTRIVRFSSIPRRHSLGRRLHDEPKEHLYQLFTKFVAVYHFIILTVS